jgi:hypothetical protein
MLGEHAGLILHTQSSIAVINSSFMCIPGDWSVQALHMHNQHAGTCS